MTDFCAMTNFSCISEDCSETVEFNVMALGSTKGIVSCPNCHHQYHFDEKFIEKLRKLNNLLVAVKDAEDILGDSNVAVTTPAGEVKVPYRLMLTRLNSLLTINFEGQSIDFYFRIEPIDGSFR